MVNIALGKADLDDCSAGDGDGDGQITVDEILLAVSHALNGCPVA
jgi:hypothetical protein